jgi:hypothetical protein
MAFLVELHVTPCMIKHPPGGVCDVLVVATMDDGVANTTRPVGNADVSESSGACKSAGYKHVVRMTPPKKNDPKYHSNLVSTYKSVLDAGWGIGVTHFAGGLSEMHGSRGQGDGGETGGECHDRRHRGFGIRHVFESIRFTLMQDLVALHRLKAPCESPIEVARQREHNGSTTTSRL